MIIKCSLCKREFDTKKQKNETDAHSEGAVQYLINQAKKKFKEN
jgi:hypothetical protein